MKRLIEVWGSNRRTSILSSTHVACSSISEYFYQNMKRSEIAGTLTTSPFPFGKVNHCDYALLIKLMDRKLPNEIINILETWFNISITCIKWDRHISNSFELKAGVRQGGVLSPLLFAIYIDSIVLKAKDCNSGFFISFMSVNIFLYADDIILIVPTTTGLQCLINVCESEIVKLDMRINVSKSMCVRFGPRFDKPCSELTSIHGDTLSGLIAVGIYGCTFSVVEHSNVPLTRLNLNLSVPLTLFIVKSVALLQKRLYLLY